MADVLKNKIDFVALISVSMANPNGDPLNGNRPRQNLDNLGEMSDVCIKRKIRNRMLDLDEDVFVQSSELETMFENVNVNRETARKFEAEGKQICSYLDEIKDRADQTNTRLLNLDNKLTNAVDEMEFVIERHGSDGAKLPNDAIEQLYHTFQIAKKINEIFNTPLLSNKE